MHRKTHRPGHGYGHSFDRQFRVAVFLLVSFHIGSFAFEFLDARISDALAFAAFKRFEMPDNLALFVSNEGFVGLVSSGPKFV